MLRELDWEGCVNVRELGGGIVRSDNVRKLSAAGWESAWAHGVRTVIDLRSEPECTEDAPLRDGVAHVRIGLSDFDRPARDDPEDRVEALRLWYWEHLEHNTQGIAAVFRVLADTEDGVLVHCLGGKDRTGIVSMLLLRLRDASLEEIEADYMLSEPNLRQIFEVIHAPAGVVGPVLERLEERHGSVERYLLEIGVSVEQVERLRAKLG